MTTGAPEDATVDRGAPELVAGRRAEGAQPAVEAAREHASVGDRGRRVAEPADAGRPDDVPVRGVERGDLARARDAVDPLAVARRARVEALVAECVALRGTSSSARRPSRDRGRRTSRQYVVTHTVPPNDGRARVDAPTRLVRPARRDRCLDRTAKSRPSCEPKYASPSTTTGEDSTLPAVRTCQSLSPGAAGRAR